MPGLGKVAVLLDSTSLLLFSRVTNPVQWRGTVSLRVTICDRSLPIDLNFIEPSLNQHGELRPCQKVRHCNRYFSFSISRNLQLISPGGASGIGLAIVRFFAAQSNKISILDISAASAQSVVTSLQAEFPTSVFLFKKCDISSWDEQKAVFEEVYKENGSIDYVFANAGVSEIGNFLEKDTGEPTKPSLKTIDINLMGTLYSEFLLLSTRENYTKRNCSCEIGRSLHAKEDFSKKRTDRLHRFECWPLPFSNRSYVWHFKTWGGGNSQITGEAIGTRRNTGQCNMPQLHRYARKTFLS